MGSRERQRQQQQQQEQQQRKCGRGSGMRPVGAGLAGHTSSNSHQMRTLSMDSQLDDHTVKIIPRGTGRGGLPFLPRGRRRLPLALALPLALPLALSLLLGWCSVARAQVDELRILTPLYARPGGDFWTHMVDAAQNTSVSYSVVINPHSGPGDAAEDDYTTGIPDLLDAGIEVLCYVATGFGQTNVSQVTADVDKYESFYPDLCDGFFFDEGPASEENTWKYTEYYSYVQNASGPDSTVVVNPGIQPHDSMYNIGDAYEAINPGMGGQVIVVSFENNYLAFGTHTEGFSNQEVPFPPRYIRDRYMHSILIYAAFFTSLTEFLDFTVLQLYCENWGYVFFTDDSYGDDGNPWDGTPGYFVSLLDAVAKVKESAGQCGTYAPTHAPAVAPTLSPLAPGETRAPIPTPVPKVFGTIQPAGIGETRSPTAPLPTPAPTPSPTVLPTKAPTPSPTVLPTKAPTPSPTTAPVGEREGSWAYRGTPSSSSSMLILGATILVTILRQQLF